MVNIQTDYTPRLLLKKFLAGEDISHIWASPWRKSEILNLPLQPTQTLPALPKTGYEDLVIETVSLAHHDSTLMIKTICKDNPVLAFQCLQHIKKGKNIIAPLEHIVAESLLIRACHEEAHLRARIDAGLALGHIGHPHLRSKNAIHKGQPVRIIEPMMITIPAGEFLWGSPFSDVDGFADEFTTERLITLPQYSIGRYPVTNAEYRCFIEDGGYQNDRWWSKAGQVWKQGGPDAHREAIENWLNLLATIKEMGLKEAAEAFNWAPQIVKYWDMAISLSPEGARKRAQQVFTRSFEQPAYWDDADCNNPAQPVAAVNWHEAEAYCRWLSEMTKKNYRLPTEIEWEKAARGVHGNQFPWGDDFQELCANTVETHIFASTPVGIFPSGKSPYGIDDMGGNVWEWMTDWYDSYRGGVESASENFGMKYKVVRGGSWSQSWEKSRCAFRDYRVRVDLSNQIGFRLCITGNSAYLK
jgi:formylglycine-generating enzyme required for sulfatase activity